MKDHECTEQRFLDDVKNHQISIIKDDGLHRFIRFKRPDSTSYWFDLITWPEFLCISGDCGTYVFSRTEDMFKFFRMNDNDFNKKGAHMQPLFKNIFLHTVINLVCKINITTYNFGCNRIGFISKTANESRDIHFTVIRLINKVLCQSRVIHCN